MNMTAAPRHLGACELSGWQDGGGAAEPEHQVDLLRRLWTSYLRLRTATTVGELFSLAAALAWSDYGFSRGVVLSVSDGLLTASETGPSSDDDSDLLRRRVLAGPIVLSPDSVETSFVRRPETALRDSGRRPSDVAKALGLANAAVGAVVAESQTLAVVVVDRPSPVVTRSERTGISALAAILGVALERIVLRARLGEVSAEMRQMNHSLQALISEVIDAPTSLPSEHRHGRSFALVDGYAARAGSDLDELFTKREIKVLELLSTGLSNREIAQKLVLGQETVKAEVARILRKLNATNRVDAAARFVRMSVRR